MVLSPTIKMTRALSLLTGPHVSQSGTLYTPTATLSPLRTMTLAVRDRHCIYCTKAPF